MKKFPSSVETVCEPYLTFSYVLNNVSFCPQSILENHSLTVSPLKRGAFEDLCFFFKFLIRGSDSVDSLGVIINKLFFLLALFSFRLIGMRNQGLYSTTVALFLLTIRINATKAIIKIPNMINNSVFENVAPKIRSFILHN